MEYSEMFEFHKDFETPESSTQIWRYMDFVSFVWMLHHSALWFSRADYFEDKWEGAYPAPTIHALKAQITEEGIESWEHLGSSVNQWKKTIFINCWHASSYESAAMWQLYAGMGNSIAIKSTVRRLADSLKKDLRVIHIGAIKYRPLAKVI